ncbi:MAG: UDP-N-acetylmuramate dehydrogenase [Vicinamibacterales bacterium]
MSALADRLAARFGPRARAGVPLAPYTTFKVGGPADWLVEADSAADIADAAAMAREAGVPLTVLGGGSNVLVGDRGVRGIVVRPRGGQAEAIGTHLVRADAGLTLNGLVRWTITRGYGGLEAWAGTPGTVGGAIYGNAHWSRVNIGELVDSVDLLGPGGDRAQVDAADMAFGYDDSRLKRSGEVLLTATFRVTPGQDPAALREVARQSLAFRKRTQPLASPSAGCIFMNPDPARDRVPDGIPPSAGALVDRAGLKGAVAGGARVSPTHGNFIVNDGTATAADIRALVGRCQAEVRERFGVDLREEIVYLGEF